MRQVKQLLSKSETCDYVEIIFDSHERLSSLDNMIVSLYINIELVSEKVGYCSCINNSKSCTCIRFCYSSFNVIISFV